MDDFQKYALLKGFDFPHRFEGIKYGRFIYMDNANRFVIPHDNFDASLEEILVFGTHINIPTVNIEFLKILNLKKCLVLSLKNVEIKRFDVLKNISAPILRTLILKFDPKLDLDRYTEIKKYESLKYVKNIYVDTPETIDADAYMYLKGYDITLRFKE